MHNFRGTNHCAVFAAKDHSCAELRKVYLTLQQPRSQRRKLSSSERKRNATQRKRFIHRGFVYINPSVRFLFTS